MAAIQCNLEIPDVRGLEDQELTVGREFFLICKGEWIKDLKQDALHFEGDANLKYQLKLSGFEFKSSDEAQLKVKSFLAGQHQMPQLILTDGEHRIDLGAVNFEVKSVLPPPQEGQEKIEPYGAMGPATIPIPMLYWLILLGSLAFVALVMGLRVWRFNQRRAMLERLKEHDAALSPLQEFHQAMRRLQRSSPVFYGQEAQPTELRQGVQELSRMFKVYISRRLRVPAFEWNERLILKDIKKYHFFVYQEYAKKIHDLFTEFRKAEGSDGKLRSQDVKQLAESLRKVLEGIENLMNREQTAQRGNR